MLIHSCSKGLSAAEVVSAPGFVRQLETQPGVQPVEFCAPSCTQMWRDPSTAEKNFRTGRHEAGLEFIKKGIL